MREVLRVMVLGAGVLACTPKASGPDLWAKACDRALATVGETSAERHDECRDDMAAHPREIADDIARCLLAGPATRTKEEEKRDFDACISTQTQAYFDRVAAAHEQLEALTTYIRDQRGPEGQSPESLSDAPEELLVGPWGHPIVYTAKGSSHELCIVGPDGGHGTKDDLCEQPFIYFQF